MGKTRKLDIFGDKRYSKAEIERARDYMRNTYYFIEIDDYKRDFPDSKATQRMTREQFLAELKVNANLYKYLINKESIDIDDCIYANPDIVKVLEMDEFSPYDALDNGAKLEDLPNLTDDVITYCLFRRIKFNPTELKEKGIELSYKQKVLYCKEFGNHELFKDDTNYKYLKLISLSESEYVPYTPTLYEKFLMHNPKYINDKDGVYVKLNELQRFSIDKDTLFISGMCSIDLFETYTGNVVLPRFTTALTTPSGVKMKSHDELFGAVIAHRGIIKGFDNYLYKILINIDEESTNENYKRIYKNPELIFQMDKPTKIDEFLAVYSKPEIAVDILGGVVDDELTVLAYYLKPSLIENPQTTDLLKIVACMSDLETYKKYRKDLNWDYRYLLASIHNEYIVENYYDFDENEVVLAVLSDGYFKERLELDDLDILDDPLMGKYISLIFYLAHYEDFEELLHTFVIDEYDTSICVKTLRAREEEISWIAFVDRFNDIPE